jgi:hypothetical protein
MKKMNKLIVLAVIMLAFTANVFSQVQATNTAGARILAPLVITSDVNMHFGTIMRGTAASTIQLTPANVRTVTSGDATLSTAAPTSAAGSFTVTGESGLVYTITLPADGVVTLTGPGTAMPVNTFVSNPSGTGTLTGGTSTLTVGATLTVGFPQTSGAYSGNFIVRVDYQ